MSLPPIRAKAWDLSTTYLLTGEKRPENGTPRVKRPMFGPDTPGGQGRGWGAWELAFRFTGIQANEPVRASTTMASSRVKCQRLITTPSSTRWDSTGIRIIG